MVSSSGSMSGKSEPGIAGVVSTGHADSPNVGFVVLWASLVAPGGAVPSDHSVTLDSEADLAGVLPDHLGEPQHLLPFGGVT